MHTPPQRPERIEEARKQYGLPFHSPYLKFANNCLSVDARVVLTFSLGYSIATREAGFLSPEATKAAFTGQLTGSSKNKKILIAVENGHPVGKVHVATSGNLTSIFGLVVAREARGRGLAKEVVNSTLFRCSHSGSNHMFCLEVDIENEPAVRAIAQKVLLKTVERSIIAFAIK